MKTPVADFPSPYMLSLQGGQISKVRRANRLMRELPTKDIALLMVKVHGEDGTLHLNFEVGLEAQKSHD
jgi:hypothetical protein